MTRFLDPIGRTFFEHSRPDGSTELEIAPGQEVCDFCLHPNPKWVYPCGPMRIAGNPNFTDSDDDWLACDRCRTVIERGNVTRAAKDMIRRGRQVRQRPEFVHRPVRQQLAIQTINLRRFLAARTGPAERWTP